MLNGRPSLFTAVVSSADSGTYHVSVDPLGTGTTGVLQGIPLAGMMAAALGFKECPTYSVGASVLCAQASGEICYIIGVIPEADIGKLGMFNRTVLKTFDAAYDEHNTLGYGTEASKLRTHNNGRPTDLVEGEGAIANELGVLLGMFQQFISLKGSELAQVQCYFLDDLVRIVSHNFQHWSSMGEMNIFHDGKSLQLEYGATHLSPESLGQPAVTSFGGAPTFTEEGQPTADDSTDFYKLEDERLKAIERLKCFVGRLGDFVHMYITRPAEETRELNGELNGKFDTGLADLHVGTDGRISLRSTTSVIIEKTNWIRIPHRVRTPEDPEGDDGDTIEYENKDPFEFDNQLKYRENPTAYFLQLRDCVSYLQEVYAYKNFVKHEKDFKLSKSIDDNEEKIEDINSIDPNTTVSFADFKLRKSGVYLMDNGGLMLKDAWGSAIVMEGGDIYLQPAKDLVQQPLRHMISKVGHSVSLAAKKNIDISSTEDGLRVKTKNQQHYYSSDEGILIQSDADNLSELSPQEEAYETGGGVVLLAKDSGIITFGKSNYAYGKDLAAIKSDQTVYIESEREITLQAAQAINLFATTDLLAIAKSNMTLLASSNFMAGGDSATNLGKQGSKIGLVPSPDAAFPTTMDGVLPVETIVSSYSSIIDSNKQTKLLSVTPYNESSAFDDIKFRFLPSDKYNLEAESDFIPMTISQQDEDAFGKLNLTPWEEEEQEGTLPFPGKDMFEDYYVKSSMQNSQLNQEDIVTKQVDGVASDARLEKASLQEYKVFNAS